MAASTGTELKILHIESIYTWIYSYIITIILLKSTQPPFWHLTYGARQLFIGPNKPSGLGPRVMLPQVHFVFVRFVSPLTPGKLGHNPLNYVPFLLAAR
ncbi:hypothetical protein E2C01_092358 [Portunus trituberculatus]|uniref:Uncharacterized protein n=1 Tax=Portunus trituberculatus TaxID=210409 RepID=A0A5B7JVK7_PORTR|nr:hypothetical protein [Portunus trituberculatus]